MPGCCKGFEANRKASEKYSSFNNKPQGLKIWVMLTFSAGQYVHQSINKIVKKENGF